MKVLLTGGAGFIGSHVIEKLLQEKCQVIVIDNLSTGLKENVPENVKFIGIDIGSEKVFEVFAKESFDAVIHLAAQTMVPVSLGRPDYDCQENILGTVNILEACRKTGVRRIVFASSAAVYGNVNRVPILESEEANPMSFYGLSKLTVEKYLKLYHKIYGLEYVVLRYSNVYGERQGDSSEGGVVSIFTRKIRQGELLTVFGDGNQTRDFIYAGDIALANWLALITSNANDVYNISTQTETSINELVRLLEGAAAKRVEKVYSSIQEGDIYRSSLNNTKAGEKLKWQPLVTLDKGLARTYKWLYKKLK